MGNNREVAIYSFDIFDTVLTRIVADPTDIFLLMESEFKRSDLQLPDELIDRFKPIRIKAESDARELSRSEDINIRDIYKQIGKLYGLNEEKISEMINIEINTEYRSIYPICSTVSHINQLREKGARIIFISDMYLPVGNLRDMMTKVGVYQEGDDLYVSSEIGFTKASGNLFRHVLEQEKCEPYQMCHCGNNLYSDVYVPAKMGICIYRTSDDELRKLLRQSSLYVTKRRAFGFLHSLFFKH